MAKTSPPRSVGGSALSQGSRDKALAKGAASVTVLGSLGDVKRRIKDGGLYKDAEKIGGDMRSSMNKERDRIERKS